MDVVALGAALAALGVGQRWRNALQPLREGCGSKNGNMDQNLRNLSWFILSHTQKSRRLNPAGVIFGGQTIGFYSCFSSFLFRGVAQCLRG